MKPKRGIFIACGASAEAPTPAGEAPGACGKVSILLQLAHSLGASHGELASLTPTILPVDRQFFWDVVVC